MSGRLIVIVVLATLATASASRMANAQDLAGSADHPAIKRFQGSVIRAQTRQEFEAYTVPLAPPDASEKKFKKEQVVEGKTVRTLYQAPAGASPLAVFRSYETALRQAGFETLYTCALRPCNPDGRIQVTLGTSRKFLTELGGKSLDDAATYLLAARQASTNTYAVVVTSHIWQDPSRTFYLVDVVEAKPLEANLVTVKAEVLADDLKKTGHAAIYGIYFDTGKATIKPESKPALEEIAKLLAMQPALKLHVVGHTDNVGTLPSNMSLSKQRADAVVNTLVNEHKIAAARLVPNGVGPLAPVASNEAEEGRAKNRRVELVGY